MRAIVLACLLILPAASAKAERDPRLQARQYYDSGIKHYNLSEYKEALSDFKDAYRLRPDPAFLFNIAQCLRQLGDFSGAANSYRAYRREVPDSPHRGEVDRLIQEMDKAVQEQRARQPPTGTEPPHDGQPTPTTTPAATPAPAAVTLRVEKRGKPIYKKPWFWVAVVGGTAVLATVIGVSAAYGNRVVDPTPTLGRVEGN
jgi:tetratricopeptide (TPR) repeat protein